MLAGCAPKEAAESTPDVAEGQEAGQVGTMQHFTPSQIQGVKSARLVYEALPMQAADENTGMASGISGTFSQTVTDEDTLAEIEGLLSKAVTTQPPHDCPFNNAALTLTLADGLEVELALAADSCTIYRVNGQYYEYLPESYREMIIDYPDNSILYGCFNEIPRPLWR